MSIENESGADIPEYCYMAADQYVPPFLPDGESNSTVLASFVPDDLIEIAIKLEAAEKGGELLGFIVTTDPIAFLGGKHTDQIVEIIDKYPQPQEREDKRRWCCIVCLAAAVSLEFAYGNVLVPSIDIYPTDL